MEFLHSGSNALSRYSIFVRRALKERDRVALQYNGQQVIFIANKYSLAGRPSDYDQSVVSVYSQSVREKSLNTREFFFPNPECPFSGSWIFPILKNLVFNSVLVVRSK